jgi:DNA adenine methylase
MKRPEQPIKRHGGKSYLAKQIVAQMPPRVKNPNAPRPDDPGWLHYVEPYFGGGAVLFENDPEGISEVIGDFDYKVANFWRVLQIKAQREHFIDMVSHTPFSEHSFDNAKFVISTIEKITQERTLATMGSVHDAAEFFIVNRQSRQALGKDFATLTRNRARRGMNAEVSAWMSAVDGLEWFGERLRRAVVFHRPALQIIRQQDGRRTLFYLDPPYPKETRSSFGEYGPCEMSLAQHFALLWQLTEIEGRFILSGYHCEMYDWFARTFGWRCVEIEIDNKASSSKTKEKKIECLWMNYWTDGRRTLEDGSST